MFRLEAPYPGCQTTVIMPSPNWGDSIEATATLNALRSMNGTLYTYVKNKEGRKRLQWDFTISRHKAIELRSFIKVYYSSIIRIVDHNNDQWLGYLLNNPFEFSASGKAVDFPGDETMDITLEFEEKE